jgi:DHA1 family bicyclomycin/chloramphenicol resistance-like MFS transporter
MKTMVKMLLFVAYMWVMADGFFGPLYALFAENIGGDILETAGAWAVFMLVSGVLHLFFGKIADKMNKAKPVMLFGYILAAVGSFGYIFIIDTVGLFIIQIILGVANAMSSSTWDGIYSRSINKGNAVSMWSYVEGGYAIITGIANMLGGIIVAIFSWTALFIVMGITQVLAAAIIFFVQDVQQMPWQ